ncbi:Putative AC9 transposase [Linum perenne]
MKARCKYCLKLLSGDSNSGTSHLRNHNRTCIHDGQQKVLGPNFLHKGKAQLVATKYNYEVAKKELCSMILVHEYPLSIAEHLGFKRFCCALQPLFKVPCRNTMKKEILTLYELTKTKIQREIDGNRGRVAVTTDMWTATNQKRGYMAITAHYIDNSWKLRSILLRFLYVPAPHTSVRLANRLCASLLDWNIDSKLSAITLDNCTTNDSMVSIIRNKLVPSNLLMDGSLLHMRCSAHILNLIVRDGLDVIKDSIDKI